MTKYLFQTSFLMLHYGSFRRAWDCVILTGIIYVALIVPYNAAFNRYDAKLAYFLFELITKILAEFLNKIVPIDDKCLV